MTSRQIAKWLGWNVAIYFVVMAASYYYLQRQLNGWAATGAPNDGDSIGMPLMFMAVGFAVLLGFINACVVLGRAALRVQRTAPPNER
jgi:hypothetical protein